MPTARSTLPLLLSTTVGLSAVSLMFALPTSAEPLPTTYSAQAAGDVFHIGSVNLDMLGETDDVDLSLSRVEGVTGSTSSPRSLAKAENLAGASAAGQSVRRGAVSSASKGADTAAPVAGSAAAGSVPDLVDLNASTLSARGRWVGDTSCLPTSELLTDSRAATQGSSLVATAVPGEDGGVTIPIVDVEIPTPDGNGPLPLPDPLDPPEDVPGLPTGGPTLPTESPTDLPIPTDIPTTLPTLPPLSFPRSGAAAQAGEEVVMASVAPGAIEQHTWLAERSASPDVRGVRAETVGTMVDLEAPAVSFFDGEIAVRMASQPRLSAYADGVDAGVVTWTPPALTLLVAGQSSPLNVPADGTPVSVNYSGNRQVVVEVSAGQLTNVVKEVGGRRAAGTASVMHVRITRATESGPLEVFAADLFPMQVEAKAPLGGVECDVIAPPKRSNPGVKLKGKDNGPRTDRLVVKALTPAARTQVTLFKVVKGKQKLVATKRLDKAGDRAFQVKDRNGKKPTKYVVKVAKGELTTAGKATRKVR